MENEVLDTAKIGQMFVTNVHFKWHSGGEVYDSKAGKYVHKPGHWEIGATLSERPNQYGSSQSMTIEVEKGIGQKLAEVLLPVVVADASRKAQQLADDSKAMLAALGERAVACIADMPADAGDNRK